MLTLTRGSIASAWFAAINLDAGFQPQTDSLRIKLAEKGRVRYSDTQHWMDCVSTIEPNSDVRVRQDILIPVALFGWIKIDLSLQ
jgi:hypothetical protein